MIPEVLVGSGLKDARRMARVCASAVEVWPGCHMVGVVAEFCNEGRACTSMAVGPALEDDPEKEVALMRCALARVLSIIVLHCGAEEAFNSAVAAVAQGARLARLAEKAEAERTQDERSE